MVSGEIGNHQRRYEPIRGGHTVDDGHHGGRTRRPQVVHVGQRRLHIRPIEEERNGHQNHTPVWPIGGHERDAEQTQTGQHIGCLET